MTRKRLVKVFRVRYERARKTAEYMVIAKSEILAIEEVIRVRHEFSSTDTVKASYARFGCTVTAKPWSGDVPTVSILVSATTPGFGLTRRPETTGASS
jgi:hypothetical protein